MAGRGKPRPKVVLTVKSGADGVSIVPVVKPLPDPLALATKIERQTALTPEEREYLVILLEKQPAAPLPPEEHECLITLLEKQPATLTLEEHEHLIALIHRDRGTHGWPGAGKYLATLLKEKPATLTPEEHEHLRTLILRPSIDRGPRAERQALRVATLYLILREWHPDKQTKHIESIVAEGFRCSVGAVRQDISLARKVLGDGLPW
jgi:hypothetical protein